MASILDILKQDNGKLNNFNGNSFDNFSRWKQKVHFLLTLHDVAYVLDTPRPSPRHGVEEEKAADVKIREKWEYHDCLCRGHILNALADDIFDAHQHMNTATELWDALEAKYKVKDSVLKMPLANRYLDFNFDQDRRIIDQVYELQNIARRMSEVGMDLDSVFHVYLIIHKLPNTWKDFRKQLMHYFSTEELSFESLCEHICIEEKSRVHYKAEEKKKSVSNTHTKGKKLLSYKSKFKKKSIPSKKGK